MNDSGDAREQGGMTVAAMQQVLDEHFSPWVLELNLTVREVSPARVVLSMRPDTRLNRVGGILSGQALMAAADTVMALASVAATGEFRPNATVDISTSFLRPAGNAEMTVVGYVVKPGRRLIFTRAEIRDSASGKGLAVASGTFAVP